MGCQNASLSHVKQFTFEVRLDNINCIINFDSEYFASLDSPTIFKTKPILKQRDIMTTINKWFNTYD